MANAVVIMIVIGEVYNVVASMENVVLIVYVVMIISVIHTIHVVTMVYMVVILNVVDLIMLNGFFILCQIEMYLPGILCWPYMASIRI